MRRHPIAAILTLILVFACRPACAGGETTAPSSAGRPPWPCVPLLPFSGDRWIGDAVCYGAHRDGQYPGGPAPSADDVREDLRLMLPHWNLIRLYGASDEAVTILEAIRAAGLDMKVMLGAWIDVEQSPDENRGPGAVDTEKAAANAREIEAAIHLANAYPGIVIAVCVGNETQVSWSDHRCSPEMLIDRRADGPRAASPSRSPRPTISSTGSRPRAGRWPPSSTSSPCTPIRCGTAGSWTRPCRGCGSRSPPYRPSTRARPW